MLRENSVEKSPVEEKASLEEHDSSSSQGDAEQTALGYGTRKVTPKAKLPYGWQLRIQNQPSGIIFLSYFYCQI